MITATPTTTIDHKINRLRNYFTSEHTKSISFRISQLEKFEKCIRANEQRIYDALWNDLHKSPEEVYLTEITLVLSEIAYHKKNLKKWAKRKRVKTPLHVLPSSSYLQYEPLGVAFIMAPWNYPFQLIMNPLVGAISSGCVALLKPSPDAPHTSQLIEQMIAECFDENYITVVQGEKETNTYLFAQRFDLIFFTGSPNLGKVVMKAASEHLTPVVLELGGKSPCIVNKEADVSIAAKRIVWGKFINAGQTCVAPDYVYVHASIQDQLLEEMKNCIESMYGTAIQNSRFYPRIITQQAMKRLIGLIPKNKIYYGGTFDVEDQFIHPTLLQNVSWNDSIMQEEIFGPLLPFVSFQTLDEAIEQINKREKPLALYYFGNKNNAKKVTERTSSGGVCINDTLMHISNHHLPFGGVGNSGMGNYHGKRSFETFSHLKPILSTPTWIDLPIKYVPFKFFKWVKQLI